MPFSRGIDIATWGFVKNEQPDAIAKVANVAGKSNAAAYVSVTVETVSVLSPFRFTYKEAWEKFRTRFPVCKEK